jgi:DNA-binding PadR family transcriptional regulator
MFSICSPVGHGVAGPVDSRLLFLYTVDDFISSTSQRKLKGAKNMGKRDHLGEFEQLVLLAVMRLGTGAYGMPIRREIEERAGRVTSVGALYLTLERLEEKGFICSKLGEATPERGGRAKRFFDVTAAGNDALKRSLESVHKMAAGVFVPEVI